MTGNARYFYALCPACETILQDTTPIPGETGRCPECGVLLVYTRELVLRVAGSEEREVEAQ